LQFDPLPATRAEAEQVAEALGVRAWVGAEATSSRLTACRSPRILHLATHAFCLGDLPSEAARAASATPEPAKPAASENPLRRVGLALAGAIRDAVEGRLTAWDVSGLELGQTELVVLPAGLPTDEAANDVATKGLSRSFVLAGAQAVITSLWSVADGPSRELLAHLYRRVLAGQPSAEALREAQLGLRAAYPHPAVWGAMVCFGKGTTC
jgi:CHAT domain-containing protein